MIPDDLDHVVWQILSMYVLHGYAQITSLGIEPFP